MTNRTALADRVFSLARLVVITLVVALLAIFMYGASLFPTYVPERPELLLSPDWTAEGARRALDDLGLSVRAYVWFQFICGVLTAAPFVLGAALILMRRATRLFGLYVALLFALFGTGTSYIFDVLMVVHPGWHTLLRMMGWIVWGAFLPFGYVFPDGRFVPRWTRWLVLGWVTCLVVSFMQTTHDGPPSPWMAAAVLITLGGAVVSQAYRYLYCSDPVQRQQTKWILWAIMVIAVTFTITLVINLSLPIASDTTGRGMLFQLFNRVTGVLTTSLLPIAVGVAILRYRLWDVDILINRTLVYGTLTAILALVYIGSIVVLQTLLRPLVGADSELATVASTLAIAALFQPLRRRIQHTIDRRLYRRKYDSQRVLESFAARLRNETDLEALTRDMVQIVEETLQPTQVSLWLREPARNRREQQL